MIPPLRVRQVIYYCDGEYLCYITRFENRRSHQIVINDTRCYTERSFMIDLPRGRRPSFNHGFHPNSLAIIDSGKHILEPFGSTEIVYKSKYQPDGINNLIFDIGSSHGDYYLKCKSVTFADTNAQLSFGEPVEQKVFHSKTKALLHFYWQRFLYWNKS